ncbi:MAG: YfhO family protein [Lachnospiraceae bacterium]|nr:YfhO family protein [Lachnospiraceae bacterium]
MKLLLTNTDKKRSWIFGVSGVIAATLILALAFGIQKIYPFGDRTLVYHDMQYQYTDFFLWFRNVLHGEDSIVYSFAKGLGGNVVALVAYYLASPFNLLAYFATAENMAEFLTVLIGMKLILCHVTAYIYLTKRFQTPPFYTMILAIGYAFMGYNVLQCSNVMWLDGVIILPILAWGIYGCVWKGTKGIYFLALFYGVFSNWYIGYILCLFAVLYFLFELILKNGRNFFWKGLDIFRQTGRFAATSVLAVMSTGMLFLPQALQMAKEGEKFDWSIFRGEFSFPFLSGARDLFLNGDKLTWSESNPPIFVGSFMILWVVLFLFSKKTESWKRYLAVGFLAGGMVVFNFKPFNYFFSVLKVPSSHTYRYAFLYSFFLLVVAALCIQEQGEKPGKREMGKAVGILVFLALFYDYIQPYTSRRGLYMCCFFIVAIGFCLTGMDEKKTRKRLAFGAVILACTVAEFVGKLTMEFMDHTQSASMYTDYNSSVQKVVNAIKTFDPGCYRMDKTFTRFSDRSACNSESMAFGYSAVSHYSSTNNVKLAEILKAMGYSSDTTIIPFTSMLPMDSLLGIKYVLSKYPIAGYELVEKDVAEGIDLYRNPYALSAGYPSMLSKLPEGQTGVFEYQEQFLSGVLGESAGFYTKVDVAEESTDSLSQTEWKIHATEDGPLYVYFTNGQPGMQIYVNGEYLCQNNWYDNTVRCLGEFQKGETVIVQVRKGSGPYMKDYGFCGVSLNMEQFARTMEHIQRNPCIVQKMEGTTLLAEYEGEEPTELMFTVPYETGWRVKVNGKDASYVEKGGFIGVEVPAGKNQIEMDYELPGGGAGLALTMIGIFVFGLWEFLGKRATGRPSKKRIRSKVSS